MDNKTEQDSIDEYRREYSIQWQAVSAEIPDWSRETVGKRWDPGRKLIGTIRSYQHWKKKRGPIALFMKYISIMKNRFWSIASGSDIPLNTKIGGGLLLPHPNGVVIHPKSVIGVNCLLFQQVTLGAGGKKPGLPVLGGHVDIGAGAKILGGVSIGNHVRIGANAVVLDDIPNNSTAVGVPAKITPINDT